MNSEKSPYATTDFMVTQSGDDLEIWVDWIPAVDGDPELPVAARLEGKVLVVEPVGEGLEESAPRHVLDLSDDVLEDLPKGLVWYINGPSGVLGEHRLVVEIAQPA